ncbi:MAG: hypothetical protein RBT65_12445 [Methanolobus sp.]|nr:hypothetical protein [Methanolobus sp.]
MVRFFAKKEEKTQLTDSEIAELSKNAYDIGFKVGYHKHSELGWVSERYSMFEELAKEAGLEDLIKEQYTKGKESGIKDKERDINAGLSKKEAEKKRNESKFDYNAFGHEQHERLIESGFRSSLVTDEHNLGMISQPSFINLPESTSRSRALDRPSQLQGFKPLLPKSK